MAAAATTACSETLAASPRRFAWLRDGVERMILLPQGAGVAASVDALLAYASMTPATPRPSLAHRVAEGARRGARRDRPRRGGSILADEEGRRERRASLIIGETRSPRTGVCRRCASPASR